MPNSFEEYLGRVNAEETVEPILSNGLLRQLLHEVWLPAHFVAGWCQVRQIATPQWLRPSLAKVERIVARTAQLPSWLSPMEAIAWIVSRSPQIVGYADPERKATRVFLIEHTLPNGKRIGGTEYLPPGMTLGWLDAFAACDPDAALPSDEALSELLDVARGGRITARAIWTATGERRDIESDEWRSLTLDSPPRNERLLLPCRININMGAKQLETRWENVLFPTFKLLELWPPVDGMPTDAASIEPHPAAAATHSKNRGGRPPSWDWDAFDREMMRLANSLDGLPERPKLQNHMLEWCEQTWGKSPADSTVRGRIARLYPE